MHESNAGGSGDKADLLLPAPQRRLMEAVAETGKPVILVNMTGSAMDLRFADAHFSAVAGAGTRARAAARRRGAAFRQYSPSGSFRHVLIRRTTCPHSPITRWRTAPRYFAGDVLYRWLRPDPGKTAVTAASAEKTEAAGA